MKKKRQLMVWRFCSTVMLFFIITKNGLSQSVTRQCVSSYGSTNTSEHFTISQTVGQSFNTLNAYNVTGSVLQGFQQPGTDYFRNAETYGQHIRFSILPNPACSSFTIINKNEPEYAFISIENLYGTQIYSEELNHFSKCHVNSETWTSGIYFVTLANESDSRMTYKLIISK